MRYLGGGLGDNVFRAFIKNKGALTALGAISRKEVDLDSEVTLSNGECQGDKLTILSLNYMILQRQMSMSGKLTRATKR